MSAACVQSRFLSYRLNAWQIAVLFGSLTLLAGACVLSATRDYAAFSLLWTSHQGINMHLSALVFLLLYIVSLTGSWVGGNFLKQSFPHLLAPILAGEILANLLAFAFFFLPVLFVVLTGPAALLLQQTLFGQ